MLSRFQPNSPALNVEGHREGSQVPRVNIKGTTSAAQQQVQYCLRFLPQCAKAACLTGLPTDGSRLRRAPPDIALPLQTDKQSASYRRGVRRGESALPAWLVERSGAISMACAPQGHALRLSRPESATE